MKKVSHFFLIALSILQSKTRAQTNCNSPEPFPEIENQNRQVNKIVKKLDYANNLNVDVNKLISEIENTKLKVQLFDVSTLNKRKIYLLSEIFKLPRYNGDNFMEVINQTNNLINNFIVFKNDNEVWNVKDYWATPTETLAATAGDCEDYAILKLAILKHLGFSPKNLRMHYVKKDGTIAHMVASAEDKSGELLILDNLNDFALKKSARPDLKIISSFTANGILKNWGEFGDSPSGNGDLEWSSLKFRQKNQELQF